MSKLALHYILKTNPFQLLKLISIIMIVQGSVHTTNRIILVALTPNGINSAWDNVISSKSTMSKINQAS